MFCGIFGLVLLRQHPRAKRHEALAISPAVSVTRSKHNAYKLWHFLCQLNCSPSESPLWHAIFPGIFRGH